jgi:hypothetical protein
MEFEVVHYCTSALQRVNIAGRTHKITGSHVTWSGTGKHLTELAGSGRSVMQFIAILRSAKCIG